jgi:hypothetical protein
VADASWLSFSLTFRKHFTCSLGCVGGLTTARVITSIYRVPSLVSLCFLRDICYMRSRSDATDLHRDCAIDPSSDLLLSRLLTAAFLPDKRCQLRRSTQHPFTRLNSSYFSKRTDLQGRITLDQSLHETNLDWTRRRYSAGAYSASGGCRASGFFRCATEKEDGSLRGISLLPQRTFANQVVLLFLFNIYGQAIRRGAKGHGVVGDCSERERCVLAMYAVSCCGHVAAAVHVHSL